MALKLHDQLIQQWNEGITHRGQITVYRILKTTFGFEKISGRITCAVYQYVKINITSI